MRPVWLAALAALFIGRLAFGLTSEFWSEDETQIYLMGLRYYATGEWPYFGPDVVWTRTGIAGALQPLLVGLPMRLAPIPEAPFVLLNVLSFAALSALAWYICRRLPSLPRWLVWGWVMTAPWTLQFSTHVNNPSYVLPAGIAFFLGFFEAVPVLARRLLAPRLAFFLMGAALTWVMQIHMSWPLLVPFLGIALVSHAAGGTPTHDSGAASPAKRFVVAGIWLAAGAAIPAAVLLPTFFQYGLQGGSGGALTNLSVHFVPPDRLVTTLAQFFSFASLEINRFVANDNAKRLTFIANHPWIAPLAAVVLLAGLAQPLWMLASMFRRGPGRPDWKSLRAVVAFTVGLVYVSYCFVTEEPQAHAFYVVAPIAFIYAAECWTFIDSPKWRRVAAVILPVNMAFHAALAWSQAGEHSLYTNRPVIASAIRDKQPQMFGHRRPYAIDAGPRALDDDSRPYELHDLTIDSHTVRRGLGGAAVWTLTVTNKNSRVAFRNLVYAATYADDAGTIVQQHEDVIKDVLQPGRTKEFHLADTIVDHTFVDARIVIRAAEALLPAP
jgi:hypothetical protein